MTDNLAELKDLPALQQLARALWHRGSVRGAAVMIGAGYSKNADFQAPDTPRPPDWDELLDELVGQMYPTGREKAPREALRIAEEYRDYYGQSALDGFIRTRFPDRAWLPGALHLEILKFPWSDILTTNWDTLLERAADDVTERFYEVVRTEVDVPLTRSPRIVKLHGTIGDKDPLIFAAEDYRTYPTRRATFVNLARQVFIENDLCLLGFSGNDPNFLEWAGWVRDHLGGHARRIYLAGYLDLSTTTRRYLETHNISPIDFAPMVEHLPKNERYKAATELFLRLLRAEQPPPKAVWQRHRHQDYTLTSRPDHHDKMRKDDAYSVEVLREIATLMADDRKKYPGWLLCPAHERALAFHAHPEWAIFKPSVLALVPLAERAEILNEFVWWCRTTLREPSAKLRDALVSIMEESNPQIERAARLRFALALMRDARIEGNLKNFIKWSVVVDAVGRDTDEEWRESQYQKCLWARDHLDLAGLAKAIGLLDANNPVWRLRKAALNCEAGEPIKAAKEIGDAVAELEKAYRLDRNSIWVRSCLGWASFLNRVVGIGDFKQRDELPDARDFREIHVDPADELQGLREDANKKLRKDQEDDAEIIPLFDVGSYRRGHPKAPGDQKGLELLYELDQMIEIVGLPMRLNNVQVAADPAERIVRAAYTRSSGWYVWLLRTLHSQHDNAYLKYFGRVAIAQLPKHDADELRARLHATIEFWRNRLIMSPADERRMDSALAVNELRLALCAQSHMSVRMKPQEAKEAFAVALEIAKDPVIHHWWILEAAAELAKYTLEALPGYQQATMALRVMQFPLAAERGGAVPPNWPDLVRGMMQVRPQRDDNDPNWDQRVKVLVDAAAPNLPTRQEAVDRLAYLASHDALKPPERAAFAEALWGVLDSSAPALPTGTNLLWNQFAKLPAPAGIDAAATAAARILAPALTEMMDAGGVVDTRVMWNKQNHLVALYNMAPSQIPIPAERAEQLFDQIVEWQPSGVTRNDPLGANYAKSFNESIAQMSGDVLTFAIVPAMSDGAKNADRLGALLDFIVRTKSWRGLGALPGFVRTVPEMENNIAQAIRRGLADPHHGKVSGATSAMIRWAKLASEGTLHPMPRTLIDQLLSGIETRREDVLHFLLATATALLKTGALTPDDEHRLASSLSDLIDEATYEGINLESRRAVSISLVRQEAVRLARALRDTGRTDPVLDTWLVMGLEDPLPEVRFATMATAE